MELLTRASEHSRDHGEIRPVVSTAPDRTRYLTGLYSADAPVFLSDIPAVAHDPSIPVAIIATRPIVPQGLPRSLRA